MQPAARLAGTRVSRAARGARLPGGRGELGVKVADLVGCEVISAGWRGVQGEFGPGRFQVRTGVTQAPPEPGDLGGGVRLAWCHASPRSAAARTRDRCY